ncbi:GNAT family N-acetyltransferase [Bacillus norwichensis]|uniref:GNAT family N-acetyltransferase n=1 Tax=Bacillus norwichensis TaxID=2762217 RepID=A0ABR8VPX2_9BACI|nr:GNAT family protein [Bacillus norwichensis]MBD8006810.1 GNAT family N-acetyltransferase [Bacillus norwichensis]
MNLSLEKLRIEDSRALFEFELNNKTYFEKTVPPRGDEYYHFDVFLNQLDSLIDEQNHGISNFYLIKDINHSIVGRMNLVDIEKAQATGHLGYRVGQLYAGKGIASRALKLLLEQVSEEGIVKQVKAKTTTNNIASQRVLEKNGFERLDISDDTIHFNGVSVRFINYKWTAK